MLMPYFQNVVPRYVYDPFDVEISFTLKIVLTGSKVGAHDRFKIEVGTGPLSESALNPDIGIIYT